MKHLLVVILVTLVSCTSKQTSEQKESKTATDNKDTVATVPLNNGAKWQADEATRKSVSAMMQIVTDTTYADAAKRQQLYMNLQAKIDNLVKECRMKGAEHDALHVWLEKVVKDLKELKEEDDDDEYKEAYATLKTDVASFYQAFE